MTNALPHLEAVPLFAGLTREERGLVAGFCRVQVVEKGQTIFDEGTESKELTFVIFGRAKIVKAAQGRDVILGLFGPGEPLGVMAVLDGNAYPATAIALEPTTLLHVQDREFFGLLGQHPGMTRHLIQGLVMRQFEVTRRLADLTGSVEFRMARLFLTLAERAGRVEGDAAEIDLALSRKEIADLAATTIETAIRVMSRWGKDGTVVTHPNGFTIPNLTALRALTAG